MNVDSKQALQVDVKFTERLTATVQLDLPESAPLRGEFYKKIAGKDSAQLKAMWARLIFTGKAQPPKQVGSSAEAVKQVAGNGRAIAYVDKSAVDASVKAVLRID